MTRISVHLFRLSSESGRDMKHLLKRIDNTDKNKRWRHVGQHEVSLSEISFVARSGVYLLDFVKRREVGPGKVGVNSNIVPFDFAAGENFGEETSVLFDPENDWLLVQYNQHGVRSGSITSYLNLYEHDPKSDWLIDPVLDPNTEARLKAKTNVRAASMRFALNNRLTAELRESGVPLGSVLAELGESTGSATMEITLSKSRDPGFIDKSVRTLMRMLSRNHDDEDGVRQLELKARAAGDLKDETIDLLKHRIKAQYSSNDLIVLGGRYTVESRWIALQRLHRGWLEELG